MPSSTPSTPPSASPSEMPSSTPSASPSGEPSDLPSGSPSSSPSAIYHLETDSNVYWVNDAIEIKFSHNGAITPTTTDWIGIYATGVTPVLGQADIWAYLTTCDCQVAPLRGFTPVTSGVITVSSSASMDGMQSWPIIAQTYDVYYFSSDSINILAGPVSITIYDVPTSAPR